MSVELLLQHALAGGVLSVVAVCDGGRITSYSAAEGSSEYAPAGAGALMELIAEAARSAERGRFWYRDPDLRSSGIVLVEPVEASRVVVGITLVDRNVATLRLRQLAREVRLLG